MHPSIAFSLQLMHLLDGKRCKELQPFPEGMLCAG